MGEERRVFERKTLRGPARIVLSGMPTTIVRVLDISLGGMGVVSDSNIPVKKSFQIEFNILVRKKNTIAGIRAAAVVTHVAFSNDEGGFKVGLQFIGLTELQKQLIIQYIGTKPSNNTANEAPPANKELPEEESSPSNDEVVDDDIAKENTL